MIFANSMPTRSFLQNAIYGKLTERMKQNAWKPYYHKLHSQKMPKNVFAKCGQLVQSTRVNRKKQAVLDAFLHAYDLSSEEVSH